MSRTKLFYKMKALTGETPHAFFTQYKLNRAAEMILEGRYKISAIAELVGFMSASHFTTIFKKEFGCLPSEYSRSRRQTFTMPPAEKGDNAHTS
jgi:AraC-like DNA-binding protein